LPELRSFFACTAVRKLFRQRHSSKEGQDKI